MLALSKTAIFALLFVVPSKSTNSFPDFQISTICKQAPNLDGNNVKNTYEECIKSEQSAKKQLNKEWNNSSHGNKIICLQKIDKENSSYVALLSCLQINKFNSDTLNSKFDKNYYIETDIIRP